MSPQDIQGVTNSTRAFFGVTKKIFTPVALLFIAAIAWNSKETLKEILIHADTMPLLSSIALWSSIHFIAPIFTQLFFKSCHYHISYADAFKIHASRLPAKYIPGGVWHSVARISDYHTHGLKHKQIGFYLLSENIVSLSVSLTLGGICVSGLTHISPAWVLLSQSAIATGLIIIFLLPVLISKQLVSRPQNLSITHYISANLSLYFFWIVAALSFTQFLSAFPVISTDISPIDIGGIYIFSWGIGFLALFAPQGLGVSEYIASQLLTTDIAVNSFLVLLVSFRIIILVSDTFIWALTAFCTRRKNISDTT